LLAIGIGGLVVWIASRRGRIAADPAFLRRHELALAFGATDPGTIQFIAINAGRGGGTNVNRTTYGAEDGEVGGLIDAVTGRLIPDVRVRIAATNVTHGDHRANVSADSELSRLFQPYASLTSGNSEVATNAALNYLFTGLDPAKTYTVVCSTLRSHPGADYGDRWTLFSLVGAESFNAAHSAGSGTNYAPVLVTSNSVAINTGENGPDTPGNDGLVARWTNIQPGTDGSFEIQSTQYRPAGNPRFAGAKGYGITVFALLEFAPTVAPPVPPSGPSRESP
jgi:hypothetical protein